MGGLVWLASYPKSGNTWTRSFLHSLLNRNQDVPYDINNMQHKTAWDSSYHWYKPFLNKRPNECTNEEIARVRMQANQHMADAASDGLLFVKTHNAMVAHCNTPMINSAVTAGAVYIIRNPLDVVVSYSHHLGFDIDKTIAFMATSGRLIVSSDRMVYDLQGSWSEHVFSWTRKPNPALYLMRYEDMLGEPEKTFAGMVDFLQIECERADVANAIHASTFEKLQKMEAESGFREKPDSAKSFFRKGEVGQWETALTKAQVRKVVANHREQMERFGYLPEGYE